MKKTTKIFSTLLLLTFIFSCFATSLFASNKAEITVSAAANLKNAFTEIGANYTKKTGNPVKLIFGPTGQLAQQIENGAPVDVFAAADVKTVKGLIDDKNIIDGKTARHYASGKLVLVNSKSSSVKVNSLDDLTNDKIKFIAIANPETAPYGKAAVEALKAAKLWDKISSKVVYAKDINDALTYVNTGNAEVGFTAKSLVLDSDLSHFDVNQSLYSPLVQAMGVVKASKYQKEAFDFVKYVRSKEGKAVLDKYGYNLPK
jgi:molybdate transport system substrate-binding protein